MLISLQKPRYCSTLPGFACQISKQKSLFRNYTIIKGSAFWICSIIWAGIHTTFSTSDLNSLSLHTQTTFSSSIYLSCSIGYIYVIAADGGNKQTKVQANPLHLYYTSESNFLLFLPLQAHISLCPLPVPIKSPVISWPLQSFSLSGQFHVWFLFPTPLQWERFISVVKVGFVSLSILPIHRNCHVPFQCFLPFIPESKLWECNMSLLLSGRGIFIFCPAPANYSIFPQKFIASCFFLISEFIVHIVLQLFRWPTGPFVIIKQL